MIKFNVNPRDYDSDWDYQDALGKPAKKEEPDYVWEY